MRAGVLADAVHLSRVITALPKAIQSPPNALNLRGTFFAVAVFAQCWRLVVPSIFHACLRSLTTYRQFGMTRYAILDTWGT